MRQRPQRGFWRSCRVYFRRFRIAVWLVVLVLVGTLLYLNQVGLPGPVKRPLLNELRARGLDLQFSRLRWRFHQGIVAENARFGQPDAPFGPRLTATELQVRLNLRALTRLRAQVDSVMLRGGRFAWVFPETNGAPTEVVVENIQSELRFLPNDQWELDHFRAELAGATIQLAGVVTNASAVRSWPFFQPDHAAPAGPKDWDARFRRFAETLGRIRFSAPPELRFDVRGDAKDLQSFGLFIAISTPGADTPWGMVSEGRFTARLLPADANRTSRAQLNLQARSARTPWASITNFSLGLNLTSVEGQTNLVDCRLAFSANDARTEWASGSNVVCSANWVHSVTNPIPVAGETRLQSDFIWTKWANASQARVTARLRARSNLGPPPAPTWSWWTNLQPYGLEASVQAAEVQYSNLIATAVLCDGMWQTPQLTLSNLAGNLYGGSFRARADLDLSSRATELNLDSSVDPRRISALLPGEARGWLEQIVWDKPPHFKGEVSFKVPAGTNFETGWLAELKPDLKLHGEIEFPQSVTYKQVSVSSARAQIAYSNLNLFIKDLTVTRPEGGLAASHRFDEATGDFYWRIASSIDPGIARPLLSGGALEVLNLFKFTQPPRADVEIWGRYQEPARMGFGGQVALTNLTFRDEPISSVNTTFQFTNNVLRCLSPEVLRGTERAAADGVTVDFTTQLIYLTNGNSTAEPMFIARVIGTNIVRAIEPYRFDRPPLGHVYGTIPMHGEEGADLHFDLDGGPFHWWKFHLPHVAGHVHWAGLKLSLTNVQADFYGGKLAGAAAFDLPPQQSTEFRFAVAYTNAQLKPLVKDLFGGTNQPEGWVSGTLTVTRGTTESWRTVFGYGDASLRDGLLWEIPLFGVFSPVLNGIAPGLGSSRAKAGTCSFIITNGVIWSRDLDLRCTGMRLKYHGGVDLESQVNARVEAELMRDVWVVGPLVSTVFWPVTKMFEYKVTGTLAEPKADPVFIVPKVLLFPFHPLKTLKGFLPEASGPEFAPLAPEPQAPQPSEQR